jgi:hypothetical protein
MLLVVACGAGTPATAPCTGGRTMLDGVCVSQPVADYVACVRAQGARLDEDRSRKLSAEVGYAAARAAAVTEVGDKLQKQYAAADANVLEIIRTCGTMRASEDDVCGRSGSALVSCGYENEPGWLSKCQASPGYRACLASHAGDCVGLSACGFDEVSRLHCGGASLGRGAAGCQATGDCTHKCGGDARCNCACFAATARAATLGVGIVGQCFELHCAACGTPGGAGCDQCFREHCQKAWDGVCRGR